MNKFYIGLVTLAIALTIPLTIISLNQNQDNRSKAASARVNVDVQPGGSINSAIESAGSGGTVNVAAGTYNETLDISASDVTIQATGGRVITNGTMKISGQNVKLIGFTVKGSSSFGAQVNGADGLLLKDFEIDGSQDGGLIISGSKNVVVDGCNIHGTNAEGTSADGEALSITGGSTGFEVKNCQVHDNGEEGIDAKYNGAGDVNGTIHDNVVFGNRGPNIYVDGSSGVKIYNNTSYGTTEGSKAGIMIAAETSYGGSENPKRAGNIDIFNNVIYGNAGGGITFWVESGGTLSDIRIYNNTIDEDRPLNIDASPGGTNPVFNNIFTSSPNGGGIQLGDNITSNPGFVGNGDYHLTAGSAAIDKGQASGAPAFDKDNKARPAGSGIDMGAYEFGATGGTNPSGSPAPSLITPTIYCVGGNGQPPCAPIDTTTTPGAGGGTPGAGTPGVTGGVNPSGGASTPYPSNVEPCQDSTSSVMHNKKKHKKKYKKNRGGFIERFIKFLIWLIEYILRGGNVPPPIDPGDPCPEPTTEPTPSTDPTPSTGTTPSVEPSTSPPASQSGAIYLGAAVDPGSLGDAAYADALKKKNFTSLTAENAMKFAATEPNRGQFNFSGGDTLVNFAQANNMRVRGHTLVWHDEREIPGWVNGLSNAEAEAAMKNHIQTLMTRYKGKVQQWDVVNEAFEDDGTLRNSVWKQKLGDNYIEKAFQWAREADPNAQLFYNDFGTEGIADRGGNKKVKSDAVYNMVKDFKARGIPIDGVGLQTHSAGDYPGTGAEIGANIKRLTDLGVKVEITELDVVDAPGGDQAARYAEIGTACKQNGCTGITTWGLYDGATWLSGKNPLLLDVNFQEKPAYTALINAIK